MKRAIILLSLGVFLAISCEKKEQNCLGNIDLKIGETTEIKSGETACNSQYELLLRVVNVNDSRCPEGVMCDWEGNASVEFQLTTQKSEYSFTLDTHQGTAFKSDTIIEGVKYQLRNVLPYPIHGEEQLIKTIRILVDNADVNFNATVLGKGLDCGNSFLIQFDEGVVGLPSAYRLYYAINLPESYKLKNERVHLKFRAPENDEIMVCTAMGPAYPHIYIVEVR